jgi:Ni/Co efflux regulator RcnB
MIMHKMLFAALAATVLVPVGASAQSAREVRQDQREINRDRREVRRDVRRGDSQEARRDRRELRDDRRERRDDWRDYRRTHRSVYTRPAYAWPRGYRYRPLGVGALLDRVFWGSRYRIGNYSTYRLPYPGRNRAWVRYGDDVLLINTRNGRIIQVYNRFFY